MAMAYEGCQIALRHGVVGAMHLECKTKCVRLPATGQRHCTNRHASIASGERYESVAEKRSEQRTTAYTSPLAHAADAQHRISLISTG
jgi:hypothetical protein